MTTLLFDLTPEQRRPSRFEEFWHQCVPGRRIGKRAAEIAYERATKRGASEDAIIAGMMRYAASKRDTDVRYVKHPATWLNQDCWLDDDRGSTPPPSFMDIVRG